MFWWENYPSCYVGAEVFARGREPEVDSHETGKKLRGALKPGFQITSATALQLRLWTRIKGARGHGIAVAVLYLRKTWPTRAGWNRDRRLLREDSVMRSLILSLAVVVGVLGFTALTPSKADAQLFRRGYSYNTYYYPTGYNYSYGYTPSYTGYYTSTYTPYSSYYYGPYSTYSSYYVAPTYTYATPTYTTTYYRTYYPAYSTYVP
jgi:hypothetical protein